MVRIFGRVMRWPRGGATDPGRFLSVVSVVVALVVATLLLRDVALQFHFGASGQAAADQASASNNYYQVISTANGLEFDDSGQNRLLGPAPTVELCYAAAPESPRDVYNSSFEVANADGVPEGWTINRPHIRVSSAGASTGRASLAVDLTHARKAAFVLSPPLAVAGDEDHQVSVAVDWRHQAGPGPGSTGLELQIVWYSSSDGTGTANLADNARHLIWAGEAGTSSAARNDTPWQTSMLMKFALPSAARSYRIRFVTPSTGNGIYYLANVKVWERTSRCWSNGPATPVVTTNGDRTTVSFSENVGDYVRLNQTYLLDKNSPFVQYDAEVEYLRDVLVVREAFDFPVATVHGSVMTRNLVMSPMNPNSTYESDRFTTRAAQFANGVTFPGTDDALAMKLSADGTNTTHMTFYLDNEQFHPVTLTEPTWSIGPETQRSAGEKAHLEITFALGYAPPILAKARQPDGYKATMVFLEDVHQKLLGIAEALAFGTEDKGSPVYGTKGFVGHGLVWTKSVFANPASGAKKSDSVAFAQHLDDLFRAGVEIGPHSILGTKAAGRDAASKGLAALAKYGPRTWTDHSVSGGILEDLAGEGAVKGSPYYIVDLLRQYGYRYAWDYLSYQCANGNDQKCLNILQPGQTDAIRPILFHANRIDDNINQDQWIYLFPRMPTNGEPEQYLTKDHIDQLIAERGVNISYDHYGQPELEGHTFEIQNNKAVIAPAFDDGLAYASERQKAGDLWVPTMSQFGDYLLALDDVNIKYAADGSALVQNVRQEPIDGLTLITQKDLNGVKVNGQPWDNFSDRQIVLPRIGEGEIARLDLSFKQ